MATSGELAQVLSATLGFKLGTVQFYGQALREEGLLSTAGRGPAAAAMTQDDAINWLIAMCSAETARSAPAVVKLTRDTPLDLNHERGELRPLDGEPAFIKAKSVRALVAALMDDEAAGRLSDLEVDVDFVVGGGWVVLRARQIDTSWELTNVFMYTAASAIPTRRRDTDERPATAKRHTINQISKGVFGDLNAALSGRAEG